MINDRLDVIEKEMSLVPAEFDRQLARLVERLQLSCEAQDEWKRDNHGYQLAGQEQLLIRIDIEAMPPRRIASISLPVMRVRIVFLQASNVQKEEFARYFDLYFRKGGG
ncbi:hypothetical protein MIB92_04330 [Aestuariirhabdus sp. Z084]|uniref:hypothetical protein n=1 Tax=Aestuariirhabdus haliotis TaxID=2918751 RepID=UPI00201B3DF9|nr:hypothetical protein [Aestuariirhabdus haliotis]MCL6414867.1 hypothetical protein [Aestuariirhabdus haliotis]MCL6418799.1 hypothetical protein [Aestuariirhabdus haliotis]